jgi:alanyl-tRNA synthetase
MTPKKAVELGALALFGEKYGDEVRVVFMGKENNGFFSTELCGGTHVKNTKEIGEFKVISQSSIASGVRRVEALRDEKLKHFEKFLNEEKINKEKNLLNQIEIIKNELKKLNIKPNHNKNSLLEESLKNLNKQLDQAKVKNTIQNKNKITDKKFDNLILRKQVLNDLPPKELRGIVDKGKKEIKSGIIMACCTYEGKIGVAIGITEKLVEKFDAVKLVKEVAEILGGKGGGGRKDFAQAGGINKDKIDEAFKFLSKKIN